MSYATAGSRHFMYLLGLFSITLVLTVSCAPAAEETPLATNVTVFEGARLILGDGSDAIENGSIMIQDDRITAVGAAADIQVPAGAQRVDLTGKTVMPAIVDAHKHVATEREALVRMLQDFAYFGVGAVQSMGLDGDDLAFQVRDQPIAGAARVRSAGRGITSPEPGRSEVPQWVTTEEEARAAVAGQADQVDLIKIWVDDRNGQYEKLSAELYGPVIDEAHNNNIKVAAHIFALSDAKGLLEAGLDAFAHSVRDQDVDDEFMAMVAERPDFVLIPNLPGRGVAEDMSWLSGSLPDEQVAGLQERAVDRPQAQESFGIQGRNLERMSGAGVKVALGTDGGTTWAPHQEMADMVAAGMSPAAVIVAATSVPAEFIGLTDTGTLAAGKMADFIVLDANPLDDITNTRQISSVYLRGQEVDREAIGARMSAPPTPE